MACGSTRADVVDEAAQGHRVPDVAAAVDLEQVLAVLADEAVDQAGRQIGERRRRGIGDALENVQPAEQVAGHLLLKAREQRVAIGGGQPAQQVADDLNLPHALLVVARRGKQALNLTQHLAQRLGRIDRDRRRALGQRGQSLADLGDRAVA